VTVRRPSCRTKGFARVRPGVDAQGLCGNRTLLCFNVCIMCLSSYPSVDR